MGSPRLLLVALLTGLPSLARAAGEPAGGNVQVSRAASRPHTFGLGLAVGDPTGLSAMWRPSNDMGVHMAAGWNTYTDDLRLHGDAHWSLLHLSSPSAPAVEFPVFVGVGGRLSTHPVHEAADLGVAVPVGIGLVAKKAPFDVFLELAPVVGLYPGTAVWLEGTLAGHFYF